MTDQNVDKKYSFLLRIIHFIVICCGIILTICSICCALSPYVSPNRYPNIFILFSMFGLAFWPLFFGDIFLLIILILKRSKRLIYFCILSLLILIPGLLRSLPLSSLQRDEGAIKIVSYNVGHFYCYDNKQTTQEEMVDKLVKFVEEERPDVLCLQESGNNNLSAFISSLSYELNMPYFCYGNIETSVNAIFSKYPLTQIFSQNTHLDNRGVLAVIDADEKGRFLLVNFHFASFRVTDMIEQKENRKGLYYKMKAGFKKRAEETNEILQNIPDRGIPTILCGDFNDTPLSYTYRLLESYNYNDAFLKVGSGFGTTYCGRIPLLRIDYFWYSKNILPTNHEVIKFKGSDHYPSSFSFFIEK